MNETENQPVGTPADPFPTFAALKARHSELLDLDAETDGDESYLGDVQDFFDRVRATGAILSAGEERRATQSILNYWATVLYRADRKPSNTTLVDLDPQFKPSLDDARCPYPGVREFDETEGKYFFGRQRTVDYLLARLKEESFLALVGPSGSGRSSLVRAGLLPAIKSVGLGDDSDGVQRHFFPIITPGSHPLVSLASMLSKPGDAPSVASEANSEKIREDSKYLLNFLTEKIAKPAVIVVDQFEELCTLCKDAEARRMFINNLLALENTGHKVILCSTLEDFGKGFKRLPAFQKIYERGRALLPRLGTSELSEAIIRPADLVGFKFKDQTVKDIVQEIGTLPVTLPLLQFTLTKLWEKRGTHDEYFAKSGGCRQILTQSAEEFMIELEPSDRVLAEQIFRSMVTFEYKYQARFMPVQLEPHAVPVLFRNLNELGSPQHVRTIVNRMSSAQLIRRSTSSSPEDEQIELVHESLIKNWPRLVQWIEGQKWKRFGIASVAAAMAVILFAVLVGLTAVGVYDWWQKRKAHEKAQQWAVASRRQLNDKRLDSALLLGLAAYVTDPADDNVYVRSALLSSLLFHPSPKAFLAHQGLGDVTFSPDGKLFAANDGDGKIHFWNISGSAPVSDGKPIQDPLTQADQIAPIMFSNDGQWLASAGNGAVTLWNVAPPRQQRIVLSAKEAGRISAISLSADSHRLAALGEGVVVIWDTASGNTLPIPIKDAEKIRTLALSNNGEVLAAGDEDGAVQLVDVKRRRPLRTLETCDCLLKLAATRNAISSVAFSPDDELIAISGTEETVLWSVSNGQQIKRLSLSHGSVGMILAFSQDGKTLAGFEGDKQVHLWDMRTLKPIGPGLFGPIDSTASLAFSRDCKTLASRSERGITLWDISDAQRPLAGHDDDINDLAFSPDGEFLASAGNDGVINLWKASTGESSEKLPNRSSVLSLAFSGDGKFLAGGLLNGAILVKSFDKKETFWLESMEQQNENTAIQLDQLALAFQDNQILISVAARDNYLQIERWNVVEKTRQGSANSIGLSEGTVVTAIVVSPDGKYLAVATDKKDLNLWNIGENRATPTEVVKNGSEIIRVLRFSRNGRLLYFGGTQKSTLSRYDFGTTKSDSVFTADLGGTISDVALSFDEKTLAIAVNPAETAYPTSDDREAGVVILVDVGGDKPQVIGESSRDERLPISALAFSRKEVLATARQDSTLLWDLNVCQAKSRVCSVINRSFTKEEKEQYSIENFENACQIRPVVRKECP
jgi:WD40 repeat protein